MYPFQVTLVCSWLACAAAAPQSAETPPRPAAAPPTVASLAAPPPAFAAHIDHLRREIDLAITEDRDGLCQSLHPARAAHWFRSAADRCDTVLHTAERLLGEARGEITITAPLTQLEQDARCWYARAMLDDGSLALVHGELTRAFADANLVLARIPADRDAMRLRARVEQAANSDVLLLGHLPRREQRRAVGTE